MAKYISRTLIMLGMGSVFLFGCLGANDERKPSITPPGSFSQILAPLAPETVIELTELSELAITTLGGPVAIARYFPSKDKLMAVYAGDGFLRVWDIGSANLLSEYSLGIVSKIGVGLDASGDLVMGPIYHEVRENDYGEWVAYVGGVKVWDVEGGTFLYCVVHPCEETASVEEVRKTDSPGVILDPQGRWAIAYGGLYITIDVLSGNEPSLITSFGWPEKPRHVEQIAFDSDGERYAVAFREGEVFVEEIGEAGMSLFAPKIRLGTYEEGTRHKVTALSFSLDGQWLARIQDDILTIWKLTTRDGKQLLETKITDGQMLAFDYSSKLLFVGTTEKIQVLDVDNMQFIGELVTPEITSMTISSDNRLLIWGDKSGTVHVWGLP